MYILTALISGLLFGMGVIFSGMSNPVKILAFLDIVGNWDPSLALVMAGAIPISAIVFLIAKKRKTTLTGIPLQLPDTQNLDYRLVTGSALFGIGWGLAGICPGPAIVLLGYASAKSVVFFIAMLAGMLAFSVATRVFQRFSERLCIFCR
ncbi:YeeE/YedE family protein [Oxalobacter vibrioformis]|uniref:YeeE/YedE family protein n=1 Tax=Oxalobacter vibrioformis TaxID=933080 RepID=A0A9E9M0T0_9BURK|nr:DUF6691 family protein [Oxalobacter vibrioformis]WAW10433.1 YeeE/YedE family protein [Oxalobacter vibrioformis]